MPCILVCPHPPQPPLDSQEASVSETQATSTSSFWCKGAATSQLPMDGQSAGNFPDRSPDWTLSAFFLCLLLDDTCAHATSGCVVNVKSWALTWNAANTSAKRSRALLPSAQLPSLLTRREKLNGSSSVLGWWWSPFIHERLWVRYLKSGANWSRSV